MNEKTFSLSFGFKSKREKGLLQTKSALNDVVEEVEETDFVRIVDDNEIKSVKTSKKPSGPLVIPLIKKNVWRLNDAESHPSSDTDGTKLGNDNDRLTKQAALELLEESRVAQPEEVAETIHSIPLLLQNKVPDGYEDEDKIATELRPEQSTLEEYESVPIEQFGLALLRGMGWNDGEGIGKNKKHVKPIEPQLRPKGMGLGADRSALLQAQGVKAKKIKPGDKKDEQPLALRKGTHCVIFKGPHADLYGTIDALDEDNSRCMVKLSLSQQTVTISQFNLRLVDQAEFNKYSRYLNKGKTDQYKKAEDDRSSRSGKYRREDESASDPVSHHHGRRKRSHSTEIESGKQSKYAHQKNKNDGDSSSRSHRWRAYPLLKVKIIDRNYKRGRYYTSKVVVEDVLPDSLTCRTENGDLLDGLHMDQIETVVPRDDNSLVMIVCGEHRKQMARILERKKGRERVVVQLLSDSSMLLTLSFDDVCQYVGHVDNLDY